MHMHTHSLIFSPSEGPSLTTLRPTIFLDPRPLFVSFKAPLGKL